MPKCKHTHTHTRPNEHDASNKCGFETECQIEFGIQELSGQPAVQRLPALSSQFCHGILLLLAPPPPPRQKSSIGGLRNFKRNGDEEQKSWWETMFSSGPKHITGFHGLLPTSQKSRRIHPSLLAHLRKDVSQQTCPSLGRFQAPILFTLTRTIANPTVPCPFLTTILGKTCRVQKKTLGNPTREPDTRSARNILPVRSLVV